MMVSSLISFQIWNIADIDLPEVLQGASLDQFQRNVFRIGLSVNHIGTFLIPGILFMYMYHKNESFEFLNLNKNFRILDVVMWSVLTLFSYPVIAKLAEFNMSLPLPDWMTSAQSDSMALLTQTLQMDNSLELMLSIFLVGLLAAVGEELIFRGIIQKRLEGTMNNPHAAIWTASFIFGAFHMQFERVLPLAFLGLILGYSYYYSKTLWVPTILHFLNNTIQVISVYVLSQTGNMPEIDAIPEVPTVLVIISLLITILLAIAVVRISSQPDEAGP